MELTVTSGFTNNPPISHVCKPRDRNYHHGTTYATRHVCDQNGHSKWTPAPFMAFIDVKEQFLKKKHAVNAVLFTDKAAQYAKSRMDKKNLGVFLGKKDAATLHLKFPPHLECRCMARHSSRRLHTGTQCSQCGTQTNPQVTAEASPPLT